MSWVIAQERKGTEFYWTGEVTDFGEFPKRTAKLSNARRFKTASEGYDVAGNYQKLADWRVRRA